MIPTTTRPQRNALEIYISSERVKYVNCSTERETEREARVLTEIFQRELICRLNCIPHCFLQVRVPAIFNLEYAQSGNAVCRPKIIHARARARVLLLLN